MSIAAPNGTAGRVLIADDSPAELQQLAHLLEAAGFTVSSAASGRQALELARRETPKLVISDALMPDMSGYELCSHFKSDSDLAEVPVILATELSESRDMVRMLECRADDFVLKPYDAEQVVSRIRLVLMNSEMRRHALEERVRVRTRELEQANEATRQAQTALVQQERLRAMGRMASGIAHDINNALSPISLYTEALLDHEQLSDKARGYLSIIQRAVDDVAQTLGRMREFYRPREKELQLADVELNPLIQQVIELTRARWHDLAQQRGVMIELVADLAPGLATIRGAENEIRDALTNLIFNAVDALPAGGRIRIRTRNTEVPSAHGSETHVQLEVTDSGVGMDEETRRRCLDTKGERGTGLGLAMVFGMAKRHSAGLDIESEQGKGSTFRLTFRAGTSSTSATGRNIAPLFATRSLRVLLIDDDPALLESLRSAMHDEGHKVTTTTGGQAGIDAFRDAQRVGKLFDVVITDLGMPYVDGRQVVASVRAMSPGTPIILLTGWGQHMLSDQDLPAQVDRLLGKPPRIRELRAALAELTGRRATDRVG
jgi:DNA-binding response OmpR family regulator